GAIVNSTTPRLGPRCPPVRESTLINSSRTSCASCGRSCSRSAFTSAGPRIPSSKRIVVLEETGFVMFLFLNFVSRRHLRFYRLEISHGSFPGVIACNDLNFLFRFRQPLLANFY